TDQLERDGLVERIEMLGDRRSWCVRLTEAGRQSFQVMARTHEAWIIDLMKGLTTAEQQQLYSLLSKLKQGVSSK
ncbi:MAG: MarR family transcriptional regulator, partial [Chloroflexi bacterium]|nr:MarR family transcriptional regulator [Chloroflexota bacterium]